MPQSNSGTTQIKLVSNVGAGKVISVDVESTDTIGDILNRVLNISPEGVSLRLNGEAANANQSVSNGDRLTVTPSKVSGA